MADLRLGGLLINRLLAAATTNSTLVKGSPGLVKGIIVHNNAAAVRFLKLYNKATAPTVGTDTPVMTIQIAAGTTPSIDIPPEGIFFDTGIGFGMTNLVADADTTALTANDLVLNLLYL